MARAPTALALTAGGRLRRAWRAGAADGPPVVALHGFIGGGRDFERLWEADLPRLAWLAPDLPGHGPGGAAEFPPPPADAWAAATGTVAAWLTVVGAGGRRPVLLGYSLGARLALATALARPELMAGLVLVGVSPGLENAAERAARRAEDEERARLLEHAGTAAFLRAWRALPLIATQGRIPEPWRTRRAVRADRLPADGLAASLRCHGAGAMPPQWAALPGLRVPLTLVHGAEDAKFAGLHARVAAAVPGARLVEIPGAGHCAHLENAPAFAAAVGPALGAPS